jgi:hypothetical protein
MGRSDTGFAHRQKPEQMSEIVAANCRNTVKYRLLNKVFAIAALPAVSKEAAEQP